MASPQTLAPIPAAGHVQPSGSLLRFPAQSAELLPWQIVAGFHRGAGASVVFHGPDAQTCLGAVPADHLKYIWGTLSAFPSLYWSINSSGVCYDAPQRATGRYASRKRNHLKWLNALYVDFDLHKNWGSVALQGLAVDIRRVTEAAGLPAPSWRVHSGRGLWAIWQFSEPVESTFQTRAHWQLCASELGKIFAPLNADVPCSNTINRIMRAPGSRNMSAAGVAVEFHRTGDQVGFYDLARCLGVRPAPTPITSEETERRAKNPGKQRAARARWIKAALGVEKLAAIRGHFGAGHRSWAVWILARVHRMAGTEPKVIKAKCKDLGRCGSVPPLSELEITRKTRSGMAPFVGDRVLSLSGICRLLAVTDVELARIPELVVKQRPEARATQAIRELKLFALDLGCRPSVAAARQLLESRGIKASRRSAFRYLNAAAPCGSAKSAALKELTYRRSSSNLGTAGKAPASVKGGVQ